MNGARRDEPGATREALFAYAPVLATPHDLAHPGLFPDDEEFDDFLRAYRADRQRE